MTFKPGVSGNPSGRPLLPPELRAIRGMTHSEVAHLIAKLARMAIPALREAIQDKGTPALEVALAQQWLKAAANGDVKALAMVLQYSIGTPKPGVEPDPTKLLLERMSVPELLDYVRKSLPAAQDLPLLTQEEKKE